MKIRHTHEAERIQLQMTPMIDIVFQLLIFFIMTFKIVSLEGDFNIKMPAAAPSAGPPEEDLLPPMRLRLTAGEDGQLTGIQLDDRAFLNFAELREHIMSLTGGAAGPGAALSGLEVEIDSDYNLRYESVVQAITAVTGYVTDDGSIVKLIEKIRFSPPKSE